MTNNDDLALKPEQIEWLHEAAEEHASVGLKMTMKPDEMLQLTSTLRTLLAERTADKKRIDKLSTERAKGVETLQSELIQARMRADAAEKRVAELEVAATCKFMPVGVMSQSKFENLDDGSVRFIALWPRPGVAVSRKRPDDGVLVYAKVAGIKLEVEE